MSMIMAILIACSSLCAVAAGVAILSTDEAKIETSNRLSCQGSPTNTFCVGRNQCQTFVDQVFVRGTQITADTRVSFHNQPNCEGASRVGQGYRPHCQNMGGTRIRVVYIASKSIDSVLQTVPPSTKAAQLRSRDQHMWRQGICAACSAGWITFQRSD